MDEKTYLRPKNVPVSIGYYLKAKEMEIYRVAPKGVILFFVICPRSTKQLTVLHI